MLLDADLTDLIREQNPDALFAEGFDDALIGYAYRFGDGPFALYDREACLYILMERDGMDRDSAEGFFSLIVQGAWMGEGTPAFAIIAREAE